MQVLTTVNRTIGVLNGMRRSLRHASARPAQHHMGSLSCRMSCRPPPLEHDMICINRQVQSSADGTGRWRPSQAKFEAIIPKSQLWLTARLSAAPDAAPVPRGLV